MRRNIFFLYLILPTTMAWFWLGIWVLYYLRITDYAGIGLIEMSQMLAGFLLEIPGGAVADLLGKKKTLLIALGLITIGNLWMGYSRSLLDFIGAVITISAGYAFASGTSDALLFDSLKQLKEDRGFSGHLSRIEVIKLIVVGITSVLGGFMYRISPTLPFYATALASFVGFFLCFFLQEPKIDSEKFSLPGYLKTLTKGFSELFFSSMRLRKDLYTLIVILLTTTITYEVLDGALAIQFGLQEYQLGIFFAVISIGAAVVTYFAERIPSNRTSFFVTLSYIAILLSALFSPLLGLVAGSISILLRELVYPFIRIHTSSVINHAVSSKYRATTFSTFTVLTKLPYVLFAYSVGMTIDQFGAKNVASMLITICAVLYLFTIGLSWHSTREK